MAAKKKPAKAAPKRTLPYSAPNTVIELRMTKGDAVKIMQCLQENIAELRAARAKLTADSNATYAKKLGDKMIKLSDIYMQIAARVLVNPLHKD